MHLQRNLNSLFQPTSKPMAYKYAQNFFRRTHYACQSRNSISEPCRIAGGAVQGSILGIMDHNAVLENLDDSLDEIYKAKYVDDITLIETVKENRNKTNTHTFTPPETQRAINTISNWAVQKQMKLNTNKTQVLTIST